MTAVEACNCCCIFGQQWNPDKCASKANWQYFGSPLKLKTGAGYKKKINKENLSF